MIALSHPAIRNILVVWWFVQLFGGFHKLGIPKIDQNRWFIMENSKINWMIWGYPKFRKPPNTGNCKWKWTIQLTITFVVEGTIINLNVTNI